MSNFEIDYSNVIQECRRVATYSAYNQNTKQRAIARRITRGEYENVSQEFELISELDHPNIAKYYELQADDVGDDYLIAEQAELNLEGILKERIKAEKPFRKGFLLELVY